MSEYPVLYGLAHPDGTVYRAAELPSMRALAGEVVLGEEILLRQTPEHHGTPLLVNAAPVRDQGGQVTSAVVVLQDISRIKEYERRRDEFISIIAHDLRTPLSVILMYAQVLERAAHARGAAENELKALTGVETSARRLAAMVNDLLDVSRIDARQLALDLAAVDLSPMAKSVAERLAPVLGEHALRVEVRDGVPAVRADAGRVEQVLTNLLTNAAKYSPQGSEITLSVGTLDGCALVSVRDQGPGVAPDEQTMVFERFKRTAAARAGKAKGIGLGLYIARGLVEAHGGRMWVESAPGEGSDFRFTLPLQSLQDEEAAPAPAVLPTITEGTPT